MSRGDGLIAALGTIEKGRRSVKPRYEAPMIADFGSIAAHTFSRCNPNVSGVPAKDSADVPHHIDDHLECSALDDGGGGVSP
jgi:hypothetical protein